MGFRNASKFLPGENALVALNSLPFATSVSIRNLKDFK